MGAGGGGGWLVAENYKQTLENKESLRAAALLLNVMKSPLIRLLPCDFVCSIQLYSQEDRQNTFRV